MTDKALIASYQGGDRSAFTALYRKYRERLKWFVYGMLGNEQDAEDVVQDSFIKMIRYSYSYREQETKFSTWLFTIARNKALDLVRKKERRVKTTSFDDEALEDVQFAGDSPMPDSDMMSRQTVDEVLASIPEAYLDATWLRGQGYSYKEIATIMDIKIDTVKTRIHRGRKHL